MHGVPWDGHNVDGWLASEKFDGCRAFWTGEKLLTKSGREYRNVPEEMLSGLQLLGRPLDCELVGIGMSRKDGLTAACNAAIHGRWDELLYLIAFDLPDHGGDAESRKGYLYDLFLTKSPRRILFGMTERVTCVADALRLRGRVQLRGGEGIMLLRPGSIYKPGRVDCLLKMK